MPYYLFTATTAEGKTVTERIESQSLAQAKYKLEINGYSGILFYDDDMMGEMQKVVGPDYATAPGYTPEMHLDNYKKSGVKYSLLYNLKITKGLWIPLLIWNLFSIMYGPPFSFITLLGFILSGIFSIFYLWLVIPQITFDMIIEKTNKAQWQSLRRYISFMKRMIKLNVISISEWEFDMRLAASYAGEGNDQAALKIVHDYERNSDIPPRLLYGRVASLYERLGDFNTMTQCQYKAVQLSNGGALELIDYANGLVRRHKDLDTAKEILSQIYDKELTPLSSGAVSLCKGMILVEEENYLEAEFHLQESLRKLDMYKENNIFIGLFVEVKAFLLIALGSQGKRSAAQALYNEVAEYLTVHKEFDLLKRCQRFAQ